MSLSLDGNNLSISDVVDVGRFFQKVEISTQVRSKCLASHAAYKKLETSNQTIYGVSVGCGELDKDTVSSDNQSHHQRNIILAHACGVGPYMDYAQARAMMLCRLNNFLKAKSGVSENVIDCIISALNCGIAPGVPIYGSVGSSDLVPLAHMAASLMGEGPFIDKNNNVVSEKELENYKFTRLNPTGRDGLALINGLGQSLAIASLGLYDINKLLNLSICASHLAIELITPGALANQKSFVDLKNHETLNYLTNRLMQLSHEPKPSNERSPLSLRYAHSVSAALIDVIKSTQRIIVDELNAVSDNPMINSDGSFTNNSINTSSQRIAIGLDSLAIAIASSCIASERRIQQLVRKDPVCQLPPYLTHPTKEPSSNYGMMIMQYTAASLTAELKARMQARSLQSIPVGGLFEDLNSNVNHSAINLTWLIEVFYQLVAIELLATMQGYDCLNMPVEKNFQSVYTSIRDQVDTLIEPRIQSHDIKAVIKAIENNYIKAPVVVNTLDALSQHFS